MRPKTEAPLYVWTRDLPTKPGRYWFRWSETHAAKTVRVYRTEGEQELSYRYGSGRDDVDYVINAVTAGVWWSSAPIPVPAEPSL